jgi:hypothetical protein
MNYRNDQYYSVKLDKGTRIGIQADRKYADGWKFQEPNVNKPCIV